MTGGSPRGRLLALATTVLLLSGAAVAQEAEDAAPGDPSSEALGRALLRRMTVWAPEGSGRAHFVRHCRNARGGCRRRVEVFTRLIDDAARRHELDPFLLAAVAVRESGLDPLAEGGAGERGIVQLHPRGVGSRVPFVRSEAYRRRCARQAHVCQREILEAGAGLLARSIVACDGVREGLGMYNRGECGATRYTEHVMRERQRLLILAKTDARTAQDAFRR
jgi:hypothetical protein